jgi:hypothetical protein
MKNRICTLGLIFLFSPLTFAYDLSGTWSGAGKVTFSFGKTMPCSQIKIQFVQYVDGPEKLTVKRYEAWCSLLNPDWGPLSFELKENRVYLEGDEVGTYDGRLFKALMNDGSVQYAFNFLLKEDESGKISMQTYYATRNMMGAVAIEGELSRQ